MAISRAQLVKELEPGLNALFGLEYDNYDREHSEIFTMESSDRAFEEEVMLSGFGTAPTKSEGTAVDYDDAQEAFIKIESSEVDDFIINLLDSEKPYIRSRSSWVIKEKKLQKKKETTTN